jgi:hypothetical protein
MPTAPLVLHQQRASSDKRNGQEPFCIRLRISGMIGLTFDDGRECAGQVGHQIDEVEFAAFDQRCHGAPIIQHRYRGGQKVLSPIESNQPDCALSRQSDDLARVNVDPSLFCVPVLVE